MVGWKPHTSYHASGQHHQKSFGKAFDVRKKEKPNPAFKGTVNLVAFGVATGEHTAVNVRCDPKDFNAVFEGPLAMVGSEKYRTWVYVDLVEPGVSPVLFPVRLSSSRNPTRTRSLGSSLRSWRLRFRERGWGAAQHRIRPERQTAVLFGSRRAARDGARSMESWAVGRHWPGRRLTSEAAGWRCHQRMLPRARTAASVCHTGPRGNQWR